MQLPNGQHSPILIQVRWSSRFQHSSLLMHLPWSNKNTLGHNMERGEWLFLTACTTLSQVASEWRYAASSELHICQVNKRNFWCWQQVHSWSLREGLKTYESSDKTLILEEGRPVEKLAKQLSFTSAPHFSLTCRLFFRMVPTFT